MRTDALRRAKARIKVAEVIRDEAVADVVGAKDAYRWQQLARRRVNDIMAVLNFRHGGQDMARATAEPFVRSLIFALMWEQKGKRHVAVRFTANAFPNFSYEELAELSADAHAMSSQDVARLLGVSLEERQQLGLAMIGACDLSDEDYRAFLKDEDRRRRAERKRRARPRNLDVRRAEEQAKRDAIALFAEENRVKAKTVQNWIACGKAVVVQSRENGVPTVIRYRGDATFPEAGKRPSRPRGARTNDDQAVGKKKPAASSAGRDRIEKKSLHVKKYTTGAEIERAAQSFIVLKERITRPVALALASIGSGAPTGGFEAALRALDKRSAS